MPDLVYTPWKAHLARGTHSFTTAADLRVALCMTNTLCDTAQDAATLSAIGGLDEYDGANYVRKPLANENVVQDDPNNRAEFVADNLVWTALGAGTRQCQGALLYKHVDGTAANDIPVGWYELTPFNGNGGDINLNWNAEGLVQVT